ncbi:hypothetical protein [Amnibacterium sp.]|uniref:hypothetical protein n=1 Tax=Amnibacterium sp. TaxID=1872496 RepID=UPI003F7C6FD1
MTAGLLVRSTRRPTPGAIYVAAVAGFAVLLLALAASGLADPAAVALAGVPLGPLGVIAAASALPVLTAPPTPAVAALVIAAVLLIGAVNVLVAALITGVANGGRRRRR